MQYLEFHRFLVLDVLRTPGEVAVFGREVVNPDSVAQPAQAEAAAVTFIDFESDKGRAAPMYQIFKNTTFWCAPSFLWNHVHTRAMHSPGLPMAFMCL